MKNLPYLLGFVITALLAWALICTMDDERNQSIDRAVDRAFGQCEYEVKSKFPDEHLGLQQELFFACMRAKGIDKKESLAGWQAQK